MEEVHQHLPGDIVLEVFSRLPIESLIRFKSVCKSWCNLINDPSFIELQLRRSKSQPRLILWNNNEGSMSDFLLLDEDKQGTEDKWEAKKISLFGYNSNEWQNKKTLYIQIICSCNGLICKISFFSHRDDNKLHHSICIYNPLITKECVVLPPIRHGRYILSGIFGFGADSTGNYKVISLSSKDEIVEGEIITVGESSWRELEIPYELHHIISFQIEKMKMLFVDGAFYCIVTKPIKMQQIILMFDIHEEKFQTIELPPSMEFERQDDLGLREMKDFLVLYQRRISLGDIRLWKMESKGNWIQFACLNTDVRWPINDWRSSLVAMLGNNMLLFKVDERTPYKGLFLVSHLLVYCVEKKKLIPVGVSRYTRRYFTTQIFVPSLISPILVACGKAKKDMTVDH